nr:transcription factor 20 isoform X1 [Nothobranchius furzeri]
MEVSSQDPPLVAMDLSKSYNPRTCNHAEAMDLAKKPEWYHHSADGTSTFRSRVSGSYSSSGAPIQQGPESLGSYMNSNLASGLDLFHDQVHSSLWHAGFYGTDQSSGPVPESSGGEESDSGSDVIFLVSSTKEPLLCGSFIQDGVGHIVEPLSPTTSSPDEGQGCYFLPQPMSSPSPDTSYSEESSDSSVDVPVHHNRPIVLLSDLRAVYRNPTESDVDVSSEDSDVIEISVTDNKKTKLCCKESPPQSESKTSRPRERRHSARIRKSVSESPQLSSSSLRHSLKRRVKNDAVGIYNENCDSDNLMELAVKFSSSEDSVSQPALTQRASSPSEESDADVQTDRKSPPKDEQPHCKASYSKTVNRKHLKQLTGPKMKRLSKTQQNQAHRTTQQQVTLASKSSAGKRKARRRRRKVQHSGPPDLFPSREPEMLLKYLNAKEQRKERKPEAFCPFVHVEQRVCRVVNCQEEEEATVRSSRGQQKAPGTIPGFIPSTSCFHLGRPSPDGQQQAELMCCLCGQTANTMGLGDLHGPYFPSGPLGDSFTCRTEQKNEVHKLPNGHLPNSSGDDCNADKGLLRADGVSTAKVPVFLDERWIHEDCGIWSAGVFLVRGKLYGLEEAARLAQETICSTCHQAGAIMGCFQKGCSRNYHFTCAIQSGCVLNEDNFSMRCPEHKNKTFTSTTRQDKR